MGRNQRLTQYSRVRAVHRPLQEYVYAELARARAVIHNSDYESVNEGKRAIDRHFRERNATFAKSPQRHLGKGTRATFLLRGEQLQGSPIPLRLVSKHCSRGHSAAGSLLDPVYSWTYRIGVLLQAVSAAPRPKIDGSPLDVPPSNPFLMSEGPLATDQLSRT